MAESKNYFVELNGVDVGDKIEKKNGLSYLSWAWAWGELKKKHPDATYTVYENADGWFYFTDGRTCWVKTGVTVEGIEHIEYLPVMDYRNKSIPANAVTSFDVNKAIQRSLTKAVARHGLGLYIYAGEDLPEHSEDMAAPAVKKKAAAKPAVKAEQPKPEARLNLKKYCEDNGIDQGMIVASCGLNANSTEQDFIKALDFAKSINNVHDGEDEGQLPFPLD